MAMKASFLSQDIFFLIEYGPGRLRPQAERVVNQAGLNLQNIRADGTANVH
jgi:hypothetical protein